LLIVLSLIPETAEFLDSLLGIGVVKAILIDYKTGSYNIGANNGSIDDLTGVADGCHNNLGAEIVIVSYCYDIVD
jgi:hypothetical protein